jgi:hypothetical protein
MSFKAWIEKHYTSGSIGRCEFCSTDLQSAWDAGEESGRDKAFQKIRELVARLESGDADGLYNALSGIE